MCVWERVVWEQVVAAATQLLLLLCTAMEYVCHRQSQLLYYAPS